MYVCMYKGKYTISVLVTKSKCSTYIGTAGIVAKETKNMFYLVTQDDEIKGD